MFQPGDKVTWESQAFGISKRKRGEVLAFVPAEKNVVAAYPPVTSIRSKDINGNLYAGPRDRYLVKVMIGIKKPRPIYYLPYAKGVEADTSGAD